MLIKSYSWLINKGSVNKPKHCTTRGSSRMMVMATGKLWTVSRSNKLFLLVDRLKLKGRNISIIKSIKILHHRQI